MFRTYVLQKIRKLTFCGAPASSKQQKKPGDVLTIPGTTQQMEPVMRTDHIAVVKKKNSDYCSQILLYCERKQGTHLGR